MVLKDAFYRRNSVTHIARDLIGKALCTRVDGKLTSGMIVETEAYSWKERGCHAYNNKRTPRNEVMFGEGGHAYVYLCYGMHNLFNVVTNREGKADAVLIRALQPLDGSERMRQRMNAQKIDRITSGPGKLTRALGIDRRQNGLKLTAASVWLEDLGEKINRNQIQASRRIGIDYAGEDAYPPWRFTLKNNLWVSK